MFGATGCVSLSTRQKNNKYCMNNEYNFTLKFSLGNQDNPETYLDALYNAGCDDAVVGIGKRGYIILDFTRKAGTAKEAFTSAIRDVQTAIKDAVLLDHEQ